jgi:hypothetical protein
MSTRTRATIEDLYRVEGKQTLGTVTRLGDVRPEAE